ncbi:MAG: 2-oxo acid dehydrogenase subunit E2 [Chloroflexi bacterium]|nr:2-oxo acid dehydrogenase subunit E2 [Chloroflexota bacterium]MCI0784112.1 2-oxo acid dehydrogenase subunit E2 [Chloroflexota bacterium]MCI0817884.1 2-oxo acid dehydrogenase subunit E2 [Chloroflexota bacterium]MCI0831796.1 2-oxo acid dehydrogenase subunit E2 [Chloroflexota bacterium]MCI0838933.1 2-oxo acid dehydrogenase subunit E2 [Chloroflexota bacterium]
MSYTLTLPEVGETVTEGTIEKWLKAPGDKVAKYEPIVEVDTDKVNVELPSPVSGTLLEILVAEGETVPIGAELCTIDQVPGETPAEIAPAAPSEEPQPAKEPSAAAPRERGDGGGPRRATPRVRRIAEELGVDLASVEGTGPGGRIVEDDVRTFAKGARATVAGVDEEAIPVSSIRRTIARRMSESAFTAPHAWLVVEADVSELVQLRADEREAFRERTGVDLTYLPFAAHAVSQALPDHPYLNASWAEDEILLKKRVNLGVAVATERGLLVPVIKDAGRLGVAGLAQAISELGEKARDKKLQLDDVQGGTFTLDNTGAFGSIVSMPIVNLGQAAIISLELIKRRPAVMEDGAIAVRDIVNLCLSFDHRILDGHQAGAFLGDVKSRLEAFGPGSDLD